MENRKKNKWLIVVRMAVCLLTLVIVDGCHVEQGKLHFDELKLDPITIYKMSPMEQAIYCLAEGDIVAGKDLEVLHRQALERIENEPEKGEWGDLVCLALSKEATYQQVKETINALQLVMAVQPRRPHPATGFKKILEQKMQKFEQIAADHTLITRLKNEKRNISMEYKEKLQQQIEELKLQKDKVSQLKQQVRKLKEVELLLHPKE